MSLTLSFRKGFSLIEISVALVVMGILTAVAIPVALNVNRAQKVGQAMSELSNIREIIISYYKINGKLPSHDATYSLPTSTIGIPDQYSKDPIKGIPYIYFADTTAGSTDTIYIDGVPMGDISAVIISAGPNGNFDGENATPDDGRFESSGTGDFDDILYYVCELDLKGGPRVLSSQYCETYTLILSNKDVNGITYYMRTISDVINPSPYATLTPGSSITLSNLPPYTCVQISTDKNFRDQRTQFFNITSFNEGSDCMENVVIYSNFRGVQSPPLITGDLSQ